MLTALKRFLGVKPAVCLAGVPSGPFQGIGCVMISDVTSFSGVSAPVAPAQLIQLTADILERQHEIIALQSGFVEQFVGVSTIAYWEPAEPSLLASKALAAACEIVAVTSTSGKFTCGFKVGFAVADCAKALFGRGTTFRFQVVGRARSRAEAACKSLTTRPGIAIDADTLALLSAHDRDQFQIGNAENYVLRQNPSA